MDGVRVGQFRSTVSIRVLDINDILEEIWRQENESWQTYDRVREDWISLRFRGKIIDDNNCQILFAQASDLIQAYAKLGQRLFAPNVRCYLKDTAVKSNIRDSVRTTRGVDSFKYLNNGVTIIGENVDKKRLSSNLFRIHRPGVINGLQTIRSLYEAYNTLSSDQRE